VHRAPSSAISDRKENEKRLEETRAFLAQSSDMAKIGFWICDHEWSDGHATNTYSLWSEGVESIYGFHPGKLDSVHGSEPNPGEAGLNSTRDLMDSPGPWSVDEEELIYPDDRERVLDAFDRLLTKGEMLDCEYRIVLPNGETKWVHDVGGATDFRDGKCRRTYGTIQDITDQKEVSARLEEINTFLTQSSEMAKTGYWVCEHEGFTYPYWSEGMDQIFGLDSGGVDGVDKLVPHMGNSGMIHPDDAGRVQTCFAKFVTDGTPMDIEYRIVRPDNETRWIREIGAAIDFRDGKCWRSYGTTQDITERVHTEESLRESLQMNETIFADSPIGIAIFDDAGQCISVNDMFCGILGAAKQDVLAQNYHDMATWKECGLYDLALDCLATGNRKKHEIQTDSIFGKHLFAECHLASIDVNDKRHLLLMMTDMSDRKTLETQLIQQSKMATLGEMATGVAHELNQPLNVIRLAAHNVMSRVRKNSADPEYIHDKLEKIEKQVIRATSIIDHMRIFGRRAEACPSRLAPKAMVDSALGLIGEQLRLAGIDVHVDAPEASQEFLGHQVQVEQVLLNLLGNARDQLQGVKDGKHIFITIASDDKKIRILVEDNGGGIPEDVLPRIFEPFFTTKEVGAGTGLGLSISYGIVTDMGGAIEVANTERGARFTITLPAREAETAVA